MPKQEKQALLPKLRFPEFWEAGEWEEKPLGQLAKRCTQKNRDGEVKRVLTNSAEYGVVDQRDYFDKDIATQGNLEGYFIVEKGDYVYNPRISATAPVGPISKNNIATGVMSPLYTVLRFNNSNNDFYALYFKTTGWHHYMRQASSTGARHDRMAITNGDFMAMPLPVTLPGEQQKIADCLASLDELITLEAQKLDTLKTHKKGLMQQFFPAEGETLPKLRFPEFWDAGEWCYRSLKKVFSIFQGYAFSSKDSTKEGARWLKIADVGIQYMNASTPSYLPVKHKEEYKKFSVELDDYVIALTRPILSGELKMAKVDSVYDGALLNQRVGKLVTGENKDFVYCLLQTPRLIKDIEKNIAGNDPPNLSSQQIGDIAVRIPKGNEQKKIADFLASIDILITAQAKKVEGLNSHKKGLMQQLFPVIDEVDA